MYRQGDVLIVPVEWIKGEWNQNHRFGGFGGGARLRRDKGSIILAAGEATGHHHRVKGKSVRRAVREGKQLVLIGKHGATVTHEEHATINLPPGAYEIRRQREFEAPAIRGQQPRTRWVAD